ARPRPPFFMPRHLRFVLNPDVLVVSNNFEEGVLHRKHYTLTMCEAQERPVLPRGELLCVPLSGRAELGKIRTRSKVTLDWLSNSELQRPNFRHCIAGSRCLDNLHTLGHESPVSTQFVDDV